MTLFDLTTRAAAIAHRKDLGPQLNNFVYDATEAINVRFGLSLDHLINPGDSNEVLEGFPRLYLMGTLKSLYEFLSNTEKASYYSMEFEKELSQMNITAETETTDPQYSETPPKMKGGANYAT